MPAVPNRGAPHDRSAPRPQLDERRFRAAGLATSIVAALIAVVGVVIARGVFGIPLYGTPQSGVWGSGAVIGYAFSGSNWGLKSLACPGTLYSYGPR